MPVSHAMRLDARAKHWIRHLHFHGVTIPILAEVFDRPILEIETICRYPILKTEFTAPVEREESFVSPNASSHT